MERISFWKSFFKNKNIEMKLWKVVQPQTKLMMINFKSEAPILQLQINTQIIILEMLISGIEHTWNAGSQLTYFHSMAHKTS